MPKAKVNGCSQNIKTLQRQTSNYRPHMLRAHPFRWIHFPIFVGAWFILFWFILIPIVCWKFKGVISDGTAQTYIFWSVALLIFFIILGILLLFWRYMRPKPGSYDHIFLNPEYKDEKEVLCIKCMNFHPPRETECPSNSDCKNLCGNCGKNKESFNKCCQMAKTEERILEPPKYDVVLRKQQPSGDNIVQKKRRTSSDNNKRNSLRSVKSSSSNHSNVIVISSHDPHTKDLINRHQQNSPTKPTMCNITITKEITIRHEPTKPKDKEPNKEQANVTKTAAKKRPVLAPVDVELANRQSNVEFFGEKIPLKLTEAVEKEITKVHCIKECEATNTATVVPTPKTASVGSMESMNTQKFNQYLHLVEINTPFSPEDERADATSNPKSPMSPREIFFYDLIQAADKSGSGTSADSTHFGFYNKYEKKRPVSHILISSDMNFDEDVDKTKSDAIKRHTIGNMKGINLDDYKHPEHAADAKGEKLQATKPVVPAPVKATVKETPTENEDRKSVVRILRTVKKSTTEADALANPIFGERKSFLINSNHSSMSEQTSVQDLENLNKESVSKYFISDIRPRPPPKPSRQNSYVERAIDSLPAIPFSNGMPDRQESLQDTSASTDNVFSNE